MAVVRTKPIVMFLSLLASLIFMPQALAQGTVFAVVVNANNSVTNLSLLDLRKLFSGSKHSWPGGSPVKLIVRAPGCQERLALLRLLGMSEGEYRQYWTGQVVRGEADAEPLVVPSFGMAKEAVAAFPGGITLVEVTSIQPGMKVIRIDGHLPSDPRYPLH